MTFLGFDRSDLRLIFNLWRMNLADRYLGSALGISWAMVNPLLMFALFTFVFGFVFQARLPGADSTFAYAIWLICGYGPWLATTEALTSAANSIVSNSGLVKNMAFKTEVLPIAATLLGLIPLAVSLFFLLGIQLVAGERWSWSLVWLPVIIMVQFVFLTALGIFFSAITTFLRDFGILLPNLLLILLFATPIFYPSTAVPSPFRGLVFLNPFYILSSAYRAALLDETKVPLVSLAILALCSGGLLMFALAAFRRVKGFFASVI